MGLAEGYARKISLVFIVISFIGWIVFTAGFGQFVEGMKEVDSKFDPGEESQLYAYWAGSVIGPFVHILAIVHVLLWGQRDSIVGSITAVIAIMYLSAVGFGMVFGGIIVKLGDLEANKIDRSYELTFAGGFITTLCWALHLAFWPWFKKEEEESKDNSTF